jgi:hypothetical protein
MEVIALIEKPMTSKHKVDQTNRQGIPANRAPVFDPE